MKTWLKASIILLISAIFGVIGLTQNASAYSTAQIDSLLYGGTTTAYGWDQTCKDRLESQRSQRPQVAPRTAVNYAPSYRNLTWLSGRGQGSRVAPIDVDYGTTSVPLQLNSVVFLCAALVTPDGKGVDFARTYNNGVIMSTTDANDRSPNAVGGTVNKPAMTSTNYRINSIAVVNGGGRVVGITPGSTYATSRNDGTRYWFSTPLNFDYLPASGIQGDSTVTIRFNLTVIYSYYVTTDQCSRNGAVITVSLPTSFDQCDSQDTDMQISFKLNYKYSLTPTITVNDSATRGSAETNSQVTVKPTVTRGATDTNSKATDWRVTELRYKPGSAPSATDSAAKSNSASAPCDAFTSAGRNYCSEFQKDGAKVFTDTTTTGTYGYQIGDYPVGTSICFVNSVSKPTQSDTPTWAHSSMVCTIIGKKPKIQVWGGDLVSANYVNSSVSAKNINGTTRTFGSWVEYGIFAVKTITGTASGSAYAVDGLVSADNCNTSFLSFTNSGSSNCSPSTAIGNYANASSIPDVSASFPTSASTPFFGPNDLSAQSQSGVFRVNGKSISLAGADIQKGRWVVINAPEATVNITGDIKYTDGQLASVGDIPQVIIIANKIIINSNVKRVDAWLIANGSDGIIETCNINSSSYVLTGSERLTSNKCNNQLTVNGPVMAKQLWLRRTGGSGSGAASGDPAEVFNLRPDAYMWANLHSGSNNRVQTVYSTELPPRL